MSRRKQARPIRLLDDPQPPAAPPPNGESCSGSDEESPSGEAVGPACPQCGAEFRGYPELAEHSKLCLLGEDGGKTDEARRQDAENNNSLEEEEQIVFPFGSPGHVTLEALQNTKVAVAQFAATAMANNADNPAALQELAVLQSTLYTLQHQQMMQLNLIQQLQQQLQITRPKDSTPPPMVKRSRSPTPVSVKPESPPAPTPTPPPAVTVPPQPSPPVSLPPCSISSSFASSIITNLDPPPSPSEPNTLEMLQRRAQEVLDNASQGLLANNLADELAFRKNGGKGGVSPYDSRTGGRNEPFFKHRCRYCGKVFGSDSALQIHIRSHTGERPFKCNVCGSRFTTKGNLKVHFQRHSAKFPHIKMNPNPVPEHLDKYHPPLLAQMGAHQSLPPGPPPFPPQFTPLYRPPHDLVLPPQRTHEPVNKPILPVSVFGPRIEQEVPENLSSKAPDQVSPEQEYKKEPTDEEPREDRLSPKREVEAEGELERYPSPPGYDDCSLDSKYTGEDIPGDRDSPGMEKNEDSFQDQPENLSNKMNGDMKSPGQSPRSGSESGPSPAALQLTRESPAASESSSLGALDLTPRSSSAMFPGFFPPASGAPLITSALSSLTSSVLTTTAFNPLGLAVGPPVRGNTTCNLCFKTFACNSALEIHYRSHTKERPFKCTICDRGFSTKGNMKQHMLTHKIRDMPPHLFEQKQGGGTPSTTVVSPEGNLNPSVQQPQPQPSLQQPLQNQQHTPPQPSQPPQPVPQVEVVEPSRPPSPQQKIELGVKRSPPQADTQAMPLPKRQPSLPKHLCHVCNKNFSSSSALQIHMRTHTGDKPFRCSICHKAFTTKGNLKVHMGTHMWTNGASRRGRRMSLELPQLPKDTEFLHRRPDLFYPYLPAPFLNGIHQKLSELPMGGGGGGSHNGMMAFGGFPSEMKGEPRSPEKPPHSGATPPSLWDLHFERKPEEQAMPPPPRGEGLAA